MKNVLPFLEDLKKNNGREWFQSNKNHYLEAKNEFEIFIGREMLMPEEEYGCRQLRR